MRAHSGVFQAVVLALGGIAIATITQTRLMIARAKNGGSSGGGSPDGGSSGGAFSGIQRRLQYWTELADNPPDDA